MPCPLCGVRKARRACPALDHEICTVCCGTKRLTEIRCPEDCGYLAAAREHPPAVAHRQHQRDLLLFIDALRDFNQRQSQLFLAINSVIAQYVPPELQTITDADVIDAAAALAATFETASRGVIYEQRPSTRSAEHLAGAVRTLLLRAGQSGGSAFERDAAVVLHRIEQTARTAQKAEPTNPRAYLGLIERVARQSDHAPQGDAATMDSAPVSRLIVP